MVREHKKKVKSIVIHFVIGILLPTFLIMNAFLIPEPYSHPLIYLSLAPTKIMPFLENRELMQDLTIVIFGRMTPNYAPTTIIFLIIFWFFIGILLSLIYHFSLIFKKTPNKLRS